MENTTLFINQISTDEIIYSILILIAIGFFIFLIYRRVLTKRIVTNEYKIYEDYLDLVYKVRIPYFIPNPLNQTEILSIPYKYISLVKERKAINSAFYIKYLSVILLLIPFSIKSVRNISSEGFVIGSSPEAIAFLLVNIVVPVILFIYFIKISWSYNVHSKHIIVGFKLNHKVKKIKFIELVILPTDELSILICRLNDYALGARSRKESQVINQSNAIKQKNRHLYKNFDIDSDKEDLIMENADLTVKPSKNIMKKNKSLSWRPFPFKRMHKGIYRLYLLISVLFFIIMLLPGYQKYNVYYRFKTPFHEYLQFYALIIIGYYILSAIFFLLYVWIRQGFRDQKE